MISCELVLTTSDNPVIYPFEENLNKGTVLQNDQALVFLEKLRYADRLCETMNVNHFVSYIQIQKFLLLLNLFEI